MMDDAIVAALLNKESAATTYIREKYSKEYVAKFKNRHDIDFNNAHATYFLEHGELKNIDRTIDEHKCAFCLQEEWVSNDKELRLFHFSPPQKNTYKVANALLVCEECLFSIMRDTAQDFQSVSFDKCATCDEPYIVIPDEFEARNFAGTLGKHCCETCLIAAGMLEESYDQENTCVSCREFNTWSITLKQELSNRAFLCPSCDTLGPENDDTEFPEYPAGGTKVKDPNIFYHIQRYKDTRFAALVYSIENFAHERLAFDIVRLTEDYNRVEYTMQQYGLSYTNDYLRSSVSHLQRLMQDAFTALEATYTEKKDRFLDTK